MVVLRFLDDYMDEDMTELHEMSYEQFGKLRFLDFFPRTEDYAEDSAGGLETGLGMACSEGYGITYFASPMGSNMQTAEILLDFDNGCPEVHGNALLSHLGLGLRRGILHSQINKVFRNPIEDIPTYLAFVVGQKWPYFVGCYISETEGLCKVWICRKDLADTEEEEG